MVNVVKTVIKKIGLKSAHNSQENGGKAMKGETQLKDPRIPSQD